MSKNPFRRQQLDTPRGPDLTQDDAGSASIFPDISSLGDQPRSSKTKRVRIATPPPLSPDSVKTFSYDDPSPVPRQSDGPHPGSPPPESLSDSSDSTIEPAIDDPFGRISDDEELSATGEVAYNTRRNSDTVSTPQAPIPPVVNPFQKTLATMEAGRGQPDLPSEQPESQPTAAEQKSQRPIMDVDSFKRLLMTGSAAPSPSGESTAATYVPVNSSSYSAADSSSTDTSSLSRQSIFESNFELPSETPRTSTEETRTDDDEGAATSISKQTRKAKPPLPKPRYGRPVQHVSEPSSSFPETPAAVEAIPIAPRKDLPLPPPNRKPDQLPAYSSPPPTSFSTSRSTAEPSDLEDKTSMQTPERHSLRPRPTLPLRGYSQAGASSDSTPRTAMTPSNLDSAVGASTEAPKSGRVLPPPPPPPPPPTRRSGHRSQTFTSDQSSVQSISSSPSIKPMAGSSGDIVTQPLSRTASTSSRHQMAPPPPPRRRRGSSKSSLEGPPSGISPSPRPSLDYSNVRPLSPSATEDMTAESSRNSRDVLAEMSALQEEVEALRARYRKSG